MATTKIWAIKDSVKRVIEYARNPDKTEMNDLARELHYIADDRKTEWVEDEKVYLVSPINCTGDPYEAMMKVREHFGDSGSILAHHAYQSFKPGEVTPELCHKIGVELAEKLWGDRYQVLVATHLNRSHLHNHFILNPFSFIDGKKIDSGYSNYFNLREASDEICRKYGLSVIKDPKGHTPRNIYQRSFQFIFLCSSFPNNIDQIILVHLTGKQICSGLFDIQKFLQIFIRHFAVLCQIIHNDFHLRSHCK